jgi:hypothetical protein
VCTAAVPLRDRIEIDCNPEREYAVQFGDRQAFVCEAQAAADDFGAPAACDDGLLYGRCFDAVQVVQAPASRFLSQ